MAEVRIVEIPPAYGPEFAIVGLICYCYFRAAGAATPSLRQCPRGPRPGFRTHNRRVPTMVAYHPSLPYQRLLGIASHPTLFVMH